MGSRILGYVRSNLLAVLALAVALGGTAYAASNIGAKDLKQMRVRSASAASSPARPMK